MNKSDLVSSIAEETNVSKNVAETMVNSFTSKVADALKKGENVTLVGFGTFSVADRQARTGRNPRTGEPMSIPAKKVPKFNAGKGLKEAIG
ncbi:MAG: HU family DNA-binding protein [bacterium]